MNDLPDSLEIRRSRIHGSGIYAREAIPEGTRVIEYTGEKVTKKEAERRCDAQLERHRSSGEQEGAVYVFQLNKMYDIDGNVPWNHARLINHSCDPNCEPEIIRGHIWIIALRDIDKGEEISYNYGYDLENWADHPCRCGAEECEGYIVAEEHRAALKRILKKERKKQKKRK